MSRKLFSNLKAEVVDKCVVISFSKGLDLYSKPEVEKVIKIYRKNENDFVFGNDYDEYFDSLDYKSADVIFEGKLNLCNNKNKYIYEDNDVRVGSVYVYWVSSNEGNASTGPVAVKIKDPKVWRSYEYINKCRTFVGKYTNGFRGNSGKRGYKISFLITAGHFSIWAYKKRTTYPLLIWSLMARLRGEHALQIKQLLKTSSIIQRSTIME